MSEIFHSKVKGVTFYSPPFAFIKPGDVLKCRRDPDNQYDSNAISLWWEDQQIGHLSKELAYDLAPQIDAGTVSISVAVDQVTGGEQTELFPGAQKKNQGINIIVTVDYDMNTVKELLTFPEEKKQEPFQIIDFGD